MSVEANKLSDDVQPPPMQLTGGQQLIDYMGAHLRVRYVKSEAGIDIIMSNAGPLDIPAGYQWAMYFNHVGMNNSRHNAIDCNRL